MSDYHRNLRAEIGEDAYRERLAKVRAARQHFGGAFRLDYMDAQGRTGSEIAAAAGRKGRRKPLKQENGE